MTGIGIDYSTRKIAAVAVAGGVLVGCESWRLEDRRITGDDAVLATIAAADHVVYRLHKKVSLWTSNHCVIEAPIMGGSMNARTAVGMGMVAGALASLADRHNSTTIAIVPPSSWKKQVVGGGAATKEQVGLWLQEHHPQIWSGCHDEDERDAACMALLADRHEEA